MQATRRRSHRRAEIIIIIVMMIIGVIFMLPYIWMLLDSFKPMKEIVKGKSFWPEDFTFKNYDTVFNGAPYKINPNRIEEALIRNPSLSE